MQKKVSKDNNKKTITKEKKDSRQRQIFQISDSAWFKFQAKIPTRSGVSRESSENKPVLPTPLFKDEGLKNIGHSINIGNLILVVNSDTVSYLIFYYSLLQNATDIITKCDSYFIPKCDKGLLQNASGFFLQNATILSQNATVITKCDVYYKLRRYISLNKTSLK